MRTNLNHVLRSTAFIDRRFVPIPSLRPTATGNSAVDASVGTTWERPKQVSWRNVPVDRQKIRRAHDFDE